MNQLIPGYSEWLDSIPWFKGLYSGLASGLIFTIFFSICPAMFKFIANFGSNATSQFHAEYTAMQVRILTHCFIAISLLYYVLLTMYYPFSVLLVVLCRDRHLGQLVEYDCHHWIYFKIISRRNIQSRSWNRQYDSNTYQRYMVELDSCPFLDCFAVELLVTGQHIFVLDAWVELLLPNVSRPNLPVSSLLFNINLTCFFIGFRAAGLEGPHHTGCTSTAD